MKIIVISGTIGLDVMPNDIRSQLEAAGGDDVTVEVASPGGFVVPGLEIFNLIKNYSGNVTTHLMGMAASMASYIVLAGNRITAEDNAVFMIHNAWGLAIGDHRELRKTADRFEAMSGIVAKAYARKSRKSIEEINKMMDDDTYLYGAEIAEAGFVDEVVPAGDGAETKEEALALAEMKFKESQAAMKASEEKEDPEKLAALLTEIRGAVSTPEPSAVGNEGKPAATADNQEEIEVKTLDELKKEAPGIYAEAVEIGVKQERDRRNAIQAQADLVPGNADLQTICKTAINEGTEQADFALQNKITLALQAGAGLQGDNAPGVRTVTTEPVALSDEDKEAAKLAGMSEADYAATLKEDI